MPADKVAAGCTYPSKPLKPTLASNRTVNSPITPRLAGHVATPPTSYPTIKDPNGSLRSNTSRDGQNTPIRALLNSNVTPRSSSRKTRVDIASSNSTPGTSTVGSGPIVPLLPLNGVETLRSPPTQLGAARALSPTHGASRRPQTAGVEGGPTRSPLLRSQTFAAATTRRVHDSSLQLKETKCIPASEARSPELKPLPKKAATFFYANGQLEDSSPRQLRSPSPPSSAVSGRSGKVHFFRADGTMEDDEVGPLPTPPLVSPVHLPSPASSTKISPFVLPVASRTPENIHLSYRKGASQIIKPGKHQDSMPKLATIASPPRTTHRRSISSSSSNLGSPHRRTSSLNSLDSAPSSRKSSVTVLPTPALAESSPVDATQLLASLLEHQPSPPAHAITPPPNSSLLPAIDTITLISPTSVLAQSHTVPSPRAERPIFERAISSNSMPQSPIKVNIDPQNMAQMAESAANARRERKVLDLEISNSSLLAINRQLEKEVRRQKTELRRFRRLSRAGRLSAVSDVSMASDALGTDTESVVEGGGLDGIPEVSESEAEDEEEDESDSDSISSSAEGGALSPSTMSSLDGRKLERDSKRLQLDLKRHRDLLVDSQKMNQSLKRCLAVSEEMVRAGRKALDYKVRVSDVKLGGRILDDEEQQVDVNDPTNPVERKYSLLGAWSPPANPIFETADGILGLDPAPQRTSWQSAEDSGVEVDRGTPLDPLLASKELVAVEALLAELTGSAVGQG